MGRGGFGCDPAPRHASLQLPPLTLNPFAPGKFCLPVPSLAGGRREAAGGHVASRSFPTGSTAERFQIGIAAVKPCIFQFLLCKLSLILPDCQRTSKCHSATCHKNTFSKISSLPSSITGFIFLFFPMGMLTQSRDNIWRLILTQQQSKGKMGRGSLHFWGQELEGLKILAIKKKNPKNPKPKIPGFMGIQQLLLLLLAGWILPEIKSQLLFFTPVKKQDPISHPPAGNHIIPHSLWDAGGEGGDGKELDRTRFSGMPVAGGKPGTQSSPH